MRSVQAVNSSISKSREPSVPTYLPFTTDDRDDVGLEPQYVKVKSNNTSTFTLYMGRNPGVFGYPIYNQVIQVRRSRRIIPASVQCFWNIPNTNIRNNVLRILANGIPFTVTIPEGYYTLVNLMAAWRTAINTAVTVGGWSCTITLVPDSGNVYTFQCNAANTIQIVGGTASWDDNRPLSQYYIDFRVGNTLVNSFICSPQGFYTHYFDITSQVLTHDSKTGNVDLSTPANLVLRQYLFGYLPFQIIVTLPSSSTINVDPSRMLASIDVTLYDASGSPLYVPTWDNNFDFNMEMRVEI